MTRNSVVAAFMFALLLIRPAQSDESANTFPLWGDEPAPLSRAHNIDEYEDTCWFTACAYRVSNPTLTLYQAPAPESNDLVLIIPGGGYDVVAIYHEGHHVAQALSEKGIHSAVLKYRLPDPETSTNPGKVPITDLRQALRAVRNDLNQTGLKPERVGVLGFSAGAHLAVEASVHAPKDASAKPDFSILIYGVSRLTQENLQWLETDLYHRELTPSEVAYQTLLDHVDEDTPPAFLAHAMDDDTCHYTESTEYALALTKAGVDAETHLFARGGHGFSVGRAEDGTDQWIELAANWVKRLGSYTTD